MSGDRLVQRVHHLLVEAEQVFRGHPRAETWLRHHRERLAEPLRVALLGPPRSGKSTLVNALVGEDVAPVVVDGAPAGNVWYHDGPQPLARLPRGELAALERPAGAARLGPVGHVVAAQPPWGGPEDNRVLAVEWPCRFLRHTRLLDTPGLDLPDDARSAGPVLADADAVLHVTRTLAADDLAALASARPGRDAAAQPVHVIAVLSRADETAGDRGDAVLAAKQIGRRWRRDPRVAALCQDVVAVSARMAHAGRTLRADEYAAVAAVAALPRAEADAHLLSADRFAGAVFPAAVPVERRAALLDRLGLAGVRLATTLVRTGCETRAALGAQLVRHSGLADLQASLSDLFAARREVLKARSALIALDELLRGEARPAAAYLVGELERLVAGAHEFREVRLLAALRTGRVVLPVELAVEARRLAGGEGSAHAERLGVAPDTPAEELWPAAAEAAVRWREQTTAAATANGRRAAEVVLRSCTAILNDLG